MFLAKLLAPLLAFAGRRGLREALTPRIAVSGAIGFGAVIMLQNAGIDRTSVSHAAVLVGAVPLLVALIAAGLGQASTRALTWAGYGLALAGIALVAGHSGSGATGSGAGRLYLTLEAQSTPFCTTSTAWGGNGARNSKSSSRESGVFL